MTDVETIPDFLGSEKGPIYRLRLTQRHAQGLRIQLRLQQLLRFKDRNGNPSRRHSNAELPVTLVLVIWQVFDRVDNNKDVSQITIAPGQMMHILHLNHKLEGERVLKKGVRLSAGRSQAR
jgi:hypothetical protein